MTTSSHTIRTRAAALSVATLAALGFFALPAAPAFAHDELLEQRLELNETSGAAEAIEFTFSNSILEVGTEIVVNGPEGDARDGKARVKGPKVTQKLADELPQGDYDVAWRVVSSDGHPIEGSYGFTVDANHAVQTDADAGSGSGASGHDGEEAGHSHADEGQSGGSKAEQSDDAKKSEAVGPISAEAPDAEGGGLSLGALIGIAAAATVFAVGVTVLAIVGMRRKQAMLNAMNSDGPATDDAASAPGTSADSEQSK